MTRDRAVLFRLQGHRLFVASIGNLQASSSLAIDDGVAVPCAQFDLCNVSAGAVNLLGDKSRALPASQLLTFRDVAAPMDAESFRRGVKVYFERSYGPLFSAIHLSISSRLKR